MRPVKSVTPTLEEKYMGPKLPPAPQGAMPPKSVFENDSTPNLMKKYIVYKLMGSNLFLNHSLGLMNMCYKLLGIRVTNFAINKSVASLFTSGESI